MSAYIITCTFCGTANRVPASCDIMSTLPCSWLQERAVNDLEVTNGNQAA